MITPCPKCGKRHEREHDHTANGIAGKPSSASKSTRTRVFVLMASLLAGAASASSPLVVMGPLGGKDVGMKSSSDKIPSVFTLKVTSSRRIADAHANGDQEHDSTENLFEIEADEHGHDEEGHGGYYDDGQGEDER